MKAENLSIADVRLITPTRIADERGYFSEIYKQSFFSQSVANVLFVQENQSYSKKAGTVRGLHFQLPPFGQGKLVRCATGSVFDVAVDLRKDSSTFGKHCSATLTSSGGEQLWVPEGFAHGFVTLEPDTIVIYQVTAPYSSQHDRGLLWNDPKLAISWPEIEITCISGKDRLLPTFEKVVDLIEPEGEV